MFSQHPGEPRGSCVPFLPTPCSPTAMVNRGACTIWKALDLNQVCVWLEESIRKSWVEKGSRQSPALLLRIQKDSTEHVSSTHSRASVKEAAPSTPC